MSSFTAKPCRGAHSGQCPNDLEETLSGADIEEYIEHAEALVPVANWYGQRELSDGLEKLLLRLRQLMGASVEG